MLSDPHFDPLRDPGKSARLAAAPESDWAAILREPASPTQAADFAAIQAKCGSKHGLDSDYTLLASALHAAAAQGAGARFVTLTGDLVVHDFDCRWKLATGHDTGYEDFHQKTANFVIRQVESAFPGITVYVALGNNDTPCGDYRMDLHDPYFAATSNAVLAGLVGATKQERQQAEADYRFAGYFSAAVPGLVRTRFLMIDDIYLSRRYGSCATGKEDPAPAAAVLKWLRGQLETAKAQGESVWVLGHIPPGIDVYRTVNNKHDVCAGEAAEIFLADDALTTLLAGYPGTIRLGLFGHTHSDEIRVVGDVPIKLVGSVTPVNGNFPTFTVAQVDRKTSQLADYTVFLAANKEGTGPWTEEYDYRRSYSADAFTAASLRAEIAAFRKDPSAETAPSQAYQQDFFPGSPSPLGLVWPQAVCALDSVTPSAYRTCACKQ